MSVDMKLGRWQARNGDVFIVSRYEPGSIFSPWKTDDGICWNGNGALWYDERPSEYDLVRYLGPLELSPTPACAEAGPSGSSTVSTEDRQEQLRRMRQRFVDIQREVRIYSDLLPALERAMYDVEELIKQLEREVEG